MNPEKRIDPLLRAAAAILPRRPDLHLLLVGQRAAHYDVIDDARALGLEDRVTLTGFVPDEDLPSYLGAADVAMCLRWPTARETSGAWLRCAAAGLPTVITDLAHQPHLASLDPRSWTVVARRPRAAGARRPVAVSIDILDEDHSLRLALARLAADERAPRRRSAPTRAPTGRDGTPWRTWPKATRGRWRVAAARPAPARGAAGTPPAGPARRTRGRSSSRSAVDPGLAAGPRR